MFFQKQYKDHVLTGTVSWLFLFLLVFAPLAFGAVEQWSLAVMETFAFLALFLYVLEKLKKRDQAFFAVPGIIPLVLFLSCIAIQLVPLPPGFLKQLSPATYNLYEQTFGLAEPLPWISLSIDKKATVKEFFRISAYASFYILTVQLLTRGGFLKKTVTTIIIFASCLAFQGILQFLLPNGRIYWLRELSGGGHLFGPYVNRNHYAGFMGMVFPVVLAVFLAYKPDIRSGPFRERSIGFFTRHETNTFILLAGAVILISISVFLSASRGGILNLCIGMIMCLVLYFSRARDKKSILPVILIFFLLIISVGWFGWETVIDRFARVMDEEGGRFIQWKDSLNIIRAFPLTGTGFGTFQDIYTGYSSQYWYAAIDHAQNDYLELLSEGGIIAFSLMGWFLVSVFYRSWRMFLQRRSGYSACLYIGSISGMVGMLIHSATDFNLHIGANGLYFFFLAGLAVSAAGTRLQPGTQDTFLPSGKCMHFRGIAVFPGALLFLSLSLNAGMLIGEHYFSIYKESGAGSRAVTDPARIRNHLSKATLFDPLESEYQYRLAVTDEMHGDNLSASSHYRKAIQKTPAKAEYIQGFGLFLSRIEKDDQIAEKLLRSGTERDVSNPARHRLFATWLLSQQKKEEALEEIKKAISLKPDDTSECIALLVLNGAQNEEIGRALPKLIKTRMFFASYLSGTGDKEMAGQYYRTLLEQQQGDEDVQLGYFYSAYNFYLKEGMEGDALRVMQKALEFFPDDIGTRLAYAELLEKAEQPEQAIDEYRKVLTGDPANTRATERLRQLSKRESIQHGL